RFLSARRSGTRARVRRRSRTSGRERRWQCDLPSSIRLMIEDGDPRGAADALGYLFHLTGIVEHGDRRGRELGVPTANVPLPDRKVTPAIGVYAGYVRWDGQRYPAAINIGVRPTFGSGKLLVEAHLLDFATDLYGE